MRILVAGGTGFIGTNLCRELTARGHEVTALSRNPDDATPEGVQSAVGDVTAYDSIVDAVADHDAVVNLVSLSPLYQPTGELDHETVHLGGTKNLVRAAEAGDIGRFLQMSGLDADPNAATAYLRAKGQAETVVRESDLEWTIFRPSVVFGEGDEFVGFTKTLTTPYVTGLPGGGDTRFQPIWVGDLAPMLADALEDDEHVGEIYEVAGPDVLTLADVTKLVYAAEGRSVTVLPIPTSLAKLGLSVIDPIPVVPFGTDQARSLEIDNTVADNDASVFGYEADDLRSLESALGVDSRQSRRVAP
ncbi:complex I NDUFA9 subunit family protein [Salinadaptatus halalkaliphilus]|uniref:Complex I NDUFA9 subunit family protein n=1 Tax=Salinadaptatus halalkaliphilus TaxID=2419781 RepID=A0A4S3TQY2_9EURY|nr:complex I NDUFA9 subunit family protein [Salinadaptatus halalkaliphilus]THE66801.1 complex I NDUFA9 subunit family protein [Salinadaptatus halalkaliphilus]